jgi:hypothetical protein
MARTLIASAAPSRGGTGTDVTSVLGGTGNVDTVNGNQVNNDGKRRWLVHTTTADPTFNVSFAQSVDGVVPTAQTYNLGANKWVLVGPFDTTAYGQVVNFNAGQATTTVLPID